MLPGDIIEVYDNPITKEYSQGMAKLISEYRKDTGDGLSLWIVIFLRDNFRCLRTIYNKVEA